MMTDDDTPYEPSEDGQTERPDRVLSAAAKRALAEAEARRKAQLAQEAAIEPEIDGRGGKDPARYGDWEVKGIAVDF